MRSPFILRMVRREYRSTRRRLVPYMAAITLGVAALVAINSFRTNVTRAVVDQARGLLGADLRLGSRWPFGEEVEAVLDSLSASGASVARVTSFTSMALATRSRLTRLVDVRAAESGYPFYGEIATDPPGLWGSFRAARSVLVDPAILVQLDARPGDTLAVGDARFVIRGTVTNSPGDIGLRSAIAPRIWIPSRYLADTGLLRRGSISYHLAFVRLDDPGMADDLIAARDSLFEANRVRTTTAEEYEEDLAQGLDRLGAFLGLVGLVALLLGGVGVASGVHVYVREKLDTAAVLRCIGARQRQTFSIYVIQAALMGTTGAALGVALGLGVQALLPLVVRDFLPLEVPFRVDAIAVVAGLLIGLWVALIFAFLPLLSMRDVPPLRALRRDVEPTRRKLDPWSVAVYVVVALTLVAITVWQAPEPEVGLAFAGAVALTTAGLGAAAFGLIRLVRRYFPRRAGFAVRQGMANLFRPHNQTVAVVLSIGFGVFLIATLYVVHRNLLNQLVRETRPDRPNLLLFDIQPDQEAGVKAELAEYDAPVLQETPIVPARLSRVGGRAVEEILADTTRERPRRWALLREYRHTYRDTLVDSERLVAGRWFDELDGEGVPRISLEEEIAEDLGVWVGDTLTWDIQGVPLVTAVESVRSVDWARFEPNFFVVFEPRALRDAPQSRVMMSRVADARSRAELQRDLVLSYPNVAVIDLTTIIEAVDRVLGKVAVAIRFMALFSIGCGLVILVGAIATSRYQRVRESVLLKTLGARSRAIARILATEYFALGSFAGLMGVVLAAVAGWVAVTYLFEVSFSLPGLGLVVFWLATPALTTLVGLLTSRDVIRRTPLAGMRELAE